jgi:hypothetical protein
MTPTVKESRRRTEGRENRLTVGPPKGFKENVFGDTI